MSRIAITDIKDGNSVAQAFQAADKQLRVNRQGGKYILLKLADRTGTIAAMMWNADETTFDMFDRGDYVYCHGRSQIHNGTMQLIVTQIERMDPSEVSAVDFERFDPAESARLLGELKQLLGELTDPPLRALADAYLADAAFLDSMQRAAAAVTNHHAYPGGLLRHTVDLIQLAKLVGPRYPEIDTERLMMGAFLHDLGKIEELRSGGEIAYTDRGQLVGHIVIGVQQLTEKISEAETKLGGPFPKVLRHHLEHLVVSHHGLLEYGSPKIPMTLEAVALHHLDNLDAKLSSYISIIQSDISADGNWTNFHPSISRKLWKAGGAAS